MLAHKYEEYKTTALRPFTDKLQSDYYNVIADLCKNVHKQIDKITGIGRPESHLQYVNQCNKVIGAIEKYVTDRVRVYIPYIHSLSDKASNGHDCSTCSGGCKVNHDTHVAELNMTNEEMKKVLCRLNMTTLPLYSETLFPDDYRLLRSNMTLIENNLTELFFLENNYLIPRIVDAQRTINAGNKK